MAAIEFTSTRLRILVCAFACAADPSTKFFGGGDIMGWNMVKRLGHVHRLWVLTAAQNRGAIEVALKDKALPDVQFVYVDLPGWLHPLLRHQGSLQFYAYLWQWKAYFVARELNQRIHFHVFHHLTYDNDWMASIIGALLPVPYLRGPGGGAHRTPMAFVRNYPLRERFWEQVRSIGQWLYRHDPFFVLGRRRAKAILFGNREALKAVPRKWHSKVQLFPLNGVPPTAFDGFTPGVQPGEKYKILTAGRLVRLKAFDLAIEAFKAFVEQTGLTSRGDGAEFTIVGDGPELPRLQGLVRSYGLQEQVRFETWKPQEKLWSMMRACDVFLFPSLRDGGGLVVVEAMAAGKPVICVDLGGPGMHVTEDCGIKVAPHSPEQVVRDLAAALERLYRDKGLRLQMGEAARERAAQIYHWDRIAGRMLEIYKDALGNEAGKG